MEDLELYWYVSKKLLPPNSCKIEWHSNQELSLHPGVNLKISLGMQSVYMICPTAVLSMADFPN